MRNTLIGIFLFTCLLSINAQDKITLKNGQELNVTILEKNGSKITYKFNDSISSNAIFTTKLSNLKTIHYENGMVDLLSSKNPRNKYHLGLTIGNGIVFEDKIPFVSLGLDYLFTPHFSAEINFRSLTDFGFCSFGGKYWFANKYSSSGFSPYVGFLYSLLDPNVGEVPVGLSYISKHGFQTSFQLNYINFLDLNNYRSALMVELRIGWRFK